MKWTQLLGVILAARAAAGGERLIDIFRGDQDATIYGYDPIHQTGRALVVGDFNGDGIGDLALSIVGQGPDGTRSNAGEVHVIFGGPRLSGNRVLDSSPGDVVIYGRSDSDLLGAFLRQVDLNRDGIADLLIGSPNVDVSGKMDAGEVDVFFGRRTWPPRIDLAQGPADLAVLGADARDFFGRDVFVADVSGDGVLDLGVAAPWASGPGNLRSKCGEVHVFFGPIGPGVIDLALRSGDLTVIGERAGDQIALAVDSVADVTGDGKPDLLLIAYTYDGVDGSRLDTGALYGLFSPVARASVDLATAAADLRILGSDARYVTLWAAAGDINLDGSADIAVGDDHWDQVYVFFGGSRLTGDIDVNLEPPDMIVQGIRPPNYVAQVRIGDVTGDGRADLLVSERQATRYIPPRTERTGAVYILAGDCAQPSGTDLSYQPVAIRIQGADTGDDVGWPLAIGDFDGDGFNDLFVAAQKADGLDNSVPGYTGEVYVIYGTPRVIATFDLHRGQDPGAPVLHVPDAASPIDEPPDTLTDGNDYYYSLTGPTAATTVLAANRQRRSNSVRLSWLDPDRCTEIPVSPTASAVASSARCILADGQDAATITVTPRDDFGDLLGTGLSVAIDAVAIAPGILAGEIRDNFVGSYSQEVKASVTGTGALVATAEGARIDPGQTIRFVSGLPAADFSWTGPARAGIPVDFTDMTSGGVAPYSYAWDLDGDGAADSALASPSHIYVFAGTYDVVLEVTDAQGCPTSRRRQIAVTP